MKILFYGTASYDRDSFTKELKDYPDVQIDFIETNLNPMTAALARGYDAVCAFVNSDCGAMTLEILAGFGIKLVLMRCAGFDAVNVAVAKDLGMKVTRVPAYSPEAIAEHAMGLALCANRRIHKGYIRVRENNFDLSGLVGVTLHGKTAGIVGTGRIGAALCRICKGFGMHVLGADLYPNQKLVDEERVVDEYVDYDELYRRSDLISLHAFLNEESYHMINDDSIAKMKDGVIFVNTGRGALVDSNALIRGIRSGKIGAAGLDVYEEENANVYQDREDQILGSSITARFCSFPNVVMTSHQAFFTREALSEIARVTLDNAQAYATGREFLPRSVVC
ncbi:MAG: 2-hydroxyacid dehydrogenase [Coriobacteriaceae bacterium]|uniref:2-hydroxyacid dehydrogenase n=1 Tax=Tractidigestivibacter sp. TaxID=2847320 RepID=UPI002A81D3BB|nr:2-hydroxyacid dehydrogenase [Tractidigestivibacter sp.]MCI6274770.1 2-hydroxyacid dehydrogenase [Coriobacteriaceae bacterium]MCI6548890.1 2-hydroxyacid dehydrogenase [Coriobacteriaceae bacterium]MCI6843284.1 2-hydroxyacid dehydrogenase [Coriobacteriaceae bacterium]MCI7438466.1 2-hydroxyacid dehydrogenase [Coriobacteriaceae bacterium]MDD7583957.1 2-hydroxyacid dehydrogenase [Coriobacteriaceae bacterium]